MSKFLMCWGSPYFMQPYWSAVNLDDYKNKDFFKMEYQADTPELIKKEISKLHTNMKNAATFNKEIIIGNGATQIISALMYILDGDFYAKPPHFSRFPTITEMKNKKFHKDAKNYIITAPNNPDNSTKIDEPDGKNFIYDLSYNWPQYTKPKLIDKPIMIFSLSKATGHSSSRLGWGIFKDINLAKEVEQFIEYDTAGVSMDSQDNLLSILKQQESNNYEAFKYGKMVLDYRWKIITKLKLPFSVLNNSGMFMWCNGEPPKKFSYIKGSEFGVSDDFFRLNIGCDNKTFGAFYSEYL